MASIAIAHTPWSDAATLSGGSWSAGSPLNNVKTDKLFEVARSTDATLASTKFICDLGAAQAIESAILGPTNLDKDYKVRVKGAPTNAFSSGFDSGWSTPTLTASDIDVERGVNVVVMFAAAQSYRWWQIELDNTTNVAGYVQIGKLFLPQLLKPSINYAPGSNGLSWEDNTRRVETLGKVENQSRIRNRRLINFQIPMLNESEAFGAFARFQRTVGFDKLVYVIPDPAASAAQMQERSFWGRVGQMDPITQAQFATAGVGLTIRELF